MIMPILPLAAVYTMSMLWVHLIEESAHHKTRTNQEDGAGKQDGLLATKPLTNRKGEQCAKKRASLKS